jgi:hypothetical protein
MITIYLAGPINSCTDAECNDWRTEAKKFFTHLNVASLITGSETVTRILNPMRRDYRGVETDPGISHKIVKGDKTDIAAIAASDILLVYSPKPSYGTAMEIYLAYEQNKWVVVVNNDFHPSPWLVEHSDYLVPTFEEAFEKIKGIIKERA